jgi:hypothetical protein
VSLSERVIELKEKGKDDDSDDEADDDKGNEDDDDEEDDEEAVAKNEKELEKLVDEDDDDSEDGEWDFEDDVDEDEVEIYGDDNQDEIIFLKECLNRLHKESPEVIGALFSGGENLEGRLSAVFGRNDALIEKSKKELRDAVDVVDTMLKQATGTGLQEQAQTWVSNLQQQSSSHLQHNI